MKIAPIWFHSLLLLAAFSFLAPASVHAQTPAKDKDPIRFTADIIEWSPEGDLVVGFTLFAPAGRELKLYSGTRKAHDITSTAGGNDITLVSTGDSYLIDGYTGNKIKALAQLPDKPFLGPMGLGTILQPGGNIHLGVAFPTPPNPPLGSDGKPLPYKLTLYVPFNAAPVAINPPKRP